MIHRFEIQRIQKDLRIFPGVVILGPRQVGKTTLAKHQLGLKSEDTIFIDLEKPSDIAKLNEPQLFFERNTSKTIVIDEVQRMPSLFPILRTVIDENRSNGRFILLGSSSDELITQSTESLAGRVSYHELHPFCVAEIPFEDHDDLFFLGGYPLAYQYRNEVGQSQHWIQNLIITHIQRELAVQSLKIDPQEMEKLLRIIASVNGQTIHFAQLAKLLEVSLPFIKKHLFFLERAYLIRLIQPYTNNKLKRMVKSPKIYIRDSGINHVLNGWNSIDDLDSDYQKGFAWESFVIQQIYALASPFMPKFFYKTQAGAEVDLVLLKGNKPFASFEIKYTLQPKLTKACTEALKDLQSVHNYIVIPGNDRFPLNAHVEVIGIAHLASVIEGLV